MDDVRNEFDFFDKYGMTDEQRKKYHDILEGRDATCYPVRMPDGSSAVVHGGSAVKKLVDRLKVTYVSRGQDGDCNV